MAELSREISEMLDELAEQGNEFLEYEQTDEALEAWTKGLNLIPSPQNAYSEAVWFLVSISDIYFENYDFQTALKYLEDAMGNLSGEGITNPYALLRAGQCYLEVGDEKNAIEYLLKAFMFEGEEFFDDEDPKYFDFLQSNVDLNHLDQQE